MCDGPVNLNHPIQFYDKLPEKVDVLIIGGGIIGISSALYLLDHGLTVGLVEKGRISCEQSSRNWGWIRQHGRDEAELPIMMEASRLWEELDDQVKGRTGFSRGGVMYLASSERKLAQRETWLKTASRYGLETVMLSKAEIGNIIDQGGDKNAHQWIGASYTKSDARAEPWQAVPALAELAKSKGAHIRENCAARRLEIAGGSLKGVYCENGFIGCEQVVLAGGAWSSLFLENHGISIPQLSVRSSVSLTAPMAEVYSGNASDETLAFRRRADGGYTITLRSKHDLFIGPQSFKHLFNWLPVAAEHIHDTGFRAYAPKNYPDAWGTSRNWGGEEESPFEKMRVLEPKPMIDEKALKAAFAKRFPQLAAPIITHKWAGMIDAMPDIVPIVDRVRQVDGLILATGMSGHGFGIGPGFGKIISKIAAGKTLNYDMERFRFSRFSDGSKLRPGPAI